MEEKINIESNNGVIAQSVENIIINPTKIKNSIMATILKSLIDNDIFSQPISETPTIEYEVCDKIQYNNVVKYKELFNKYASFYVICENVMNKMDDTKTGIKNKIFCSIHDKYILTKGFYLKKYKASDLSTMEVIKSHSDEILDEIFNYYYTEALNCTPLDEYNNEDVKVNIHAFLTYCFIECKLLERPVAKE